MDGETVYIQNQHRRDHYEANTANTSLFRKAIDSTELLGLHLRPSGL